jgi:hypothetical protein
MVQRFAVVVIVGAVVWLAAAGAAHAQACAAPGTGTTACTNDNTCARLAVGSVSGSVGQTVQIPITFTEGPDDGQGGKGFDDVSAVVFTVGTPGTGDTAPLSVECAQGNLASGVITGQPDNFTVVVENAQCAGRTHCLCPDTGAGQTRDNYVNIAVYGPRNLPEQGPVQIPVLPDSGNLLTLAMKIEQGASGQIPLHIFSPADATKPQFAANLSLGDQAACDVTANGAQNNVKLAEGKVTVSGGGGCVGDCNGTGDVVVNELIIGVNIALGNAPVANCSTFDANSDGMVTINELILGVNNALNGCPR